MVRNHEDGTGLRRWNFEAEASDFRVERGSGRCSGKSMEGREAHLRCRVQTRHGCVDETREKAVESARTKGKAPKWSEGEEVRIERFFRESSERTVSETPRMSPVTGNIEGVAGKSNRPAPRTERALYDDYRKAVATPRTSSATPTAREQSGWQA